jgi:membrane protease YdiL (CAAX protease family)
MFSFRKPSIRQVEAIVLFFGLSYCASHYESLVLGPAIGFLKAHLHVSFRTIFGPRPAVPVNLFTLITVERSFFAVAITWIALWVARKRWTQAGFSKDRWMRFFGTGLLSGFLSITALVLPMWAAGGLTFDGIRLPGADRASYPLRWMIGMLFAGFAEECGLRGFSLFAIAEVVGVFPAALVSALIFMGMHIGNPGENFLGLSQVFCFGLLCSMNVLRSGSIWWAIAFHAAWDWTEESFYGTIGSGYWFDGHLFQFQPHGPSMISGGTAGPEGSILVFAVLGVLLASEFVRLRREVADAAATTNQAAYHGIEAAETSEVR